MFMFNQREGGMKNPREDVRFYSRISEQISSPGCFGHSFSTPGGSKLAAGHGMTYMQDICQRSLEQKQFILGQQGEQDKWKAFFLHFYSILPEFGLKL